jgi:hypothetical protein
MSNVTHSKILVVTLTQNLLKSDVLEYKTFRSQESAKTSFP